MNARPALQAGARALAEHIDQVSWVNLTVGDQAERELAAGIVLDATRHHTKASLYLEIASEIPGDGAREREIRQWLHQRSANTRRAATN